MNETVVVAEMLKAFPILNAGLIATLIGLVLKFQIDRRKLTIQENTGLRSEFIDEMQRLREEVHGLRLENSGLRTEVAELHAIITGMRREGIQAAASAQSQIIRNMPPEAVTDTLRSAMDSLNKIPGTHS